MTTTPTEPEGWEAAYEVWVKSPADFTLALVPSAFRAGYEVRPTAPAGERVLVPREPHFVQVVAGRKALGKRPSERTYGLLEEIYIAMIAAVPSPAPDPGREALIAEAKAMEARGNFAIDLGVPDYRAMITRLVAALEEGR